MTEAEKKAFMSEFDAKMNAVDKSISDIKSFMDQKTGGTFQSDKKGISLEDISKILSKDKDITDDVHGAEAIKAFIVERLSRNADNAKMIAADEKDFALSTKMSFLSNQNLLFAQNVLQLTQLSNAYVTNYTNVLSDERVQKSGIRTPEIQNPKKG